MVDKKKIVILLLSIILLTGCGIKKNEANSYLSEYNNVSYVEGTSLADTTKTTVPTTETTTTTTTTVVPTTKKVVKTTQSLEYDGPKTKDLRQQADININKYKDKIDEMINLINVERAKEGLNPVKYDYEMSVAATIRSLEMHYTGVFEHARYCRKDAYNTDNTINIDKCEAWYTVFNELNIIYNGAGENIARGFTTVSGAMRGFMNSPTHRKNIMKPTYKYVGIGVSEDGNAFFFSQEFKA